MLLKDVCTAIATTLGWDVFGEDVTGKKLHHFREPLIDGCDWYKVYAPMDAEFNEYSMLTGISIVMESDTDIVKFVNVHYLKLRGQEYYQNVITTYDNVDDFIAQLPDLA
jgi:hypothetical protein